jgi:hypothetical protein
MPIARCPDCCRDITLAHEDLTRIIECSVCYARFGPLVTPTFVPPPPPPDVADEEVYGDGDVSDQQRVRPKRFKPKPRTRVWPIVLGVGLGLSSTAALLGAIYVLIRTQLVHP